MKPFLGRSAECYLIEYIGLNLLVANELALVWAMGK